MDLNGSAQFFLRLLLIFGFLGRFEALGDEDVCKSKEVQHLMGLLGENHIKKIEARVESKVTINQILKLNEECKTQLGTSLKLQKEMERAQNKSQERLKLVQEQVKKIDNIKTTTDYLSTVIQKIDKKLKKMDQLEKTQKSVQAEMLEIKKLIKLSKCPKFLKSRDTTKANFFKAGGKSFYFKTNAVNWYSARDWCKHKGMRQASLDTLFELQAVSNEMKKLNIASKDFWLSGSDYGRLPGIYTWADGTPVERSLLRHGFYGNKSSGGNQMCTQLSTKSAMLDIYSCSTISRTLCEVPEDLAICFNV